MVFFGRVILALFALLFAVVAASPRQMAFGFGKRNVEAVDGGDQFVAYKRPMGAKFNMGFGKRGGNRQFTMGFGKRSMNMENFDSEY